MSRKPMPKSNSRSEQMGRAVEYHRDDRPEAQQNNKQHRSIKQIQNDLDGASPDEIERLQRHQRQANAAFHDDDQAQLENEFKQRLYKPMTVEQVGAALDTKLDVPGLFSQFDDAQEVQRLGKRRQWMLHGFTPDDLEIVRDLHQWVPFRPLVQQLFQTVHFGCYGAGQHTYVVKKPLGHTVDDVKRALVHSHFNERVFSCQELVFATEVALGAKLGQVLVHDRLALFVMEWPQSQEFRVVVGFALQFRHEELREQQPAKATQEALQTEAITLCRADLTDEATDEMAVQSESVKLDLGWLRRALRYACVSYVYCACAKWQ